MGLMAKIRLDVELEYDADVMYGDSEDDRRWFFDHLLREDELILHSNENGDAIGTVKVLQVMNDK